MKLTTGTAAELLSLQLASQSCCWRQQLAPLRNINLPHVCDVTSARVDNRRSLICKRPAAANLEAFGLH